MTTALSLEDVSHRFGTSLVVDGLNLDVDPGQVVCLLGPSGSGKTTVLRIAAGLEQLQHGTVRIDGREVGSATLDVPPEQRDVGLMFQDYALFPHLSVAENVEFGLSGQDAKARTEISNTVLAQVGLAGYGGKVPYTLSGGEQQRVALARALAPKPRLMLMDEPFSGLDFRLRDQIRDDTLALLKKTGTATLLVTHDPEEAMLMADKIVLMGEGKVAQAGTPKELYYHPKSEFIAKFFGEINKLQVDVKGLSIHTPLGPLPANGLASGALADVLIRPHDLNVDLKPSATGASATVRQARLVGGNSLIDLELDNTDICLRARSPGTNLPKIGEKVVISVDPARVFVFAAEP